MRAVFLDRDGTVIVDPPDKRVDSLSKVTLLPETLEAFKLLAKLDYAVFFVSNQAGLAEGLINQQEFETINNKVLELIAPSGVKVLKTYICPHGENSDCYCRKPKPGLILDAAKDYAIDLAQSWTIGDRPSDIETGVNAGTKTILVRTGVPTVEAPQATYTAPTLLEAVQYIADHEERG